MIRHWAAPVVAGFLLALAHWVHGRSEPCDTDQLSHRRSLDPAAATSEEGTAGRRREQDGQVCDVLMGADAAVQAHLTIDLNAGMADLMARREPRANGIGRFHRRLPRTN